ncbi:hypothetical protein [Paenibacillus endoradicis]|uniref:hypothetical protein n=1 Tax=Paenibacillus endoradicis TaxID=2972487 RepID=UPI002159878A|nr:hypothetical protein [Paenibacillus endoradicis]MCR8656435.1 hypothetical protein [Paenibacillus endoradicis]
MKYSKYLIMIVIIGVAMQLPTHLELTIGEQLFLWLNIPINSNGETGFHYPVIGFFAVLVSLIVLRRIHITKYPKLFFHSILCIVIVMVIFPSVTKGVSYAVFYYSSSTAAIDVTKERCDLTINDSLVEGSCSMTVFNYGNVNQIEVVPILSIDNDHSKKIDFDPNTVQLIPHTTRNLTFKVTGIATEITSADLHSPVDVRIIN